jgi:carboxymethylenebutenolidase
MRATLDNGTPIEIVRADGDQAIVIAPDIFSLRPLYDDMVADLADRWGVTVVAVEPFPGVDLGPDIEPRFAEVARLDDARVIGDLVGAADLAGVPNVGLMGFCLGGMHCFKAVSSGRFDRIASFYGMIHLPDAWHGPGQSDPLSHVGTAPSSLLAIIGERDTYTPPDAVAELSATGAEVVIYPEAEHGFAHDASRPAHRAGDAADAFERARRHFLG